MSRFYRIHLHLVPFHLVPFLLAMAAAAASAQEIRVTGQVRERSEFFSEPLTTGNGDMVHLLRTRLGITGSFKDELSTTVEMQDARQFGGAQNAFINATPATALRLAFIEARNIGGTPFGVRVGRQELSYGNGRLLGDADWSNFGQTFDAAVIRADLDEITVDLFGAAIAQRPYPPMYARDAFLIGTWGTWAPAGLGGRLHAFYLFDNPHNSLLDQNRHTIGVHAKGSLQGVDYELDGALQLGDHFQSTALADRIPIEANMIGGRLGYTFDSSMALRIGLGYDRLSGDAPETADSYGPFSTLYATDHRYHGAMGLFTDVPSATEGLGLEAMLLQASISPIDNLHLSAGFHLFSLLHTPAGSSAIDPNPGAPLPRHSRNIGNELDISAGYAVSDWLRLSGGYSVFEGADERFVLRGNKTMQWGYFMATAQF